MEKKKGKKTRLQREFIAGTPFHLQKFRTTLLILQRIRWKKTFFSRHY